MIIRHTLTCLLCLLISISQAWAEVVSNHSSPMLTAEQIVDKNVDARGGLKAWRAVQAMTMTGKIDAGKLRTKPPIALNNFRKTRLDIRKVEPEDIKVVQLPFIMEMKRPLKMRFELEFRGDTAVQAFDGTTGWKLRPFLGRREVESYTPEEMKSASQQQQLDGFLIDYAAKGTRVESEGIERVAGRDAYRLKLTLKDGQVRHAWIDAQNFLDLMVDGARRMDGKPRKVMTYFHDFKSVDGLMVPFTLETTVEGIRDSEKIVIEKVVLNPSVEDSRFARPE